MTKVRATLLLPFIVFGAVSVSAADVSGKWRTTLKADFTSFPELICTLSQKDKQLSGGCTEAAGSPDEKAIELIDGRVDNERVSWQWKVVVPDGELWTYVVAGTVDANGTMMSGSFKVSSRFSSGQGSFTATKQ